jgi:hypothetical protein
MTVQELYDQLSDEQLADILTDFKSNNDKLGIAKIDAIASTKRVFGLYEHHFFIYKQAATRWLKNQSK